MAGARGRTAAAAAAGPGTGPAKAGESTDARATTGGVVVGIAVVRPLFQLQLQLLQLELLWL